MEVIGLDPDPKALERAKRKAEHAGVTVDFVCGFADSIPYADASFDRVLSSFMLHHLTLDGKRAALADVARVLKPGCALHVLDFVSAHERPRGAIARMLHADDHLTDSGNGRTVALLEARRIRYGGRSRLAPNAVRAGEFLPGGPRRRGGR